LRCDAGHTASRPDRTHHLFVPKVAVANRSTVQFDAGYGNDSQVFSGDIPVLATTTRAHTRAAPSLLLKKNLSKFKKPLEKQLVPICHQGPDKYFNIPANNMLCCVWLPVP
jgi:hypothetical protein